MTGLEIVKEWERRQETGCYDSYYKSMRDLALMIDENSITKPVIEIDYEDPYAARRSYRQEQASLRAAGFDAYNCDMVDEFPTW